MKKVDQEGTRRITTKYQPHEDRLYVQQDSSAFEKVVADKNSCMRAMGQTGKGSVRLHLQMSEQDYTELMRKYPGLRGGGTERRRQLWEMIAKKYPHLVALPFEKRVHGGF